MKDKKYRILLLTNRDSDNVGDQVIEISDIALIEAVMKNLHIEKTDYEICSRAASIISKKYVATKNEKLLETAEKLIKECDMVIFGGAPVFNYRYQIFYERTAVTLELAEKYHKPVIFSGIGVEQYDEKNKKCQRLKKTLNFDCVKQITTRDGIDELEKYKENENLMIGRVADPAVFSAQVFRKHLEKKKENQKKKIGIFVLRANGFVDNKVEFTREEAANLWLEVIRELEEKGYDYTLLTSGHYGDEAFLDYLIKEYNVEEKKCVFNVNTPEFLLNKISGYDGVISCRLHPSIISFSLGIPSVGLIWNSKVKRFYEWIGYAERAIDVETTGAKEIVEKVEEAVTQGIHKDKEYLMTIYQTLFYGIKNSLNLSETGEQPYDYEMLINNIPLFEGTSEKEKEAKLKRKFRRIYGTFNERKEQNNNFLNWIWKNKWRFK